MGTGSSSSPDIASRIRVRRADAADAVGLSEFAARLFRETFEADNDPADLATYLAEAFGVDRQREELNEPGAVVLLAEDVTGSNVAVDHDAASNDTESSLIESSLTGSNPDGPNPAAPLVLAGYSHLATNEAPGSVNGPDPLELKRFYVDRSWQGTGLAQLLMRATLDAAIAAGARTLWLGVWEHNPRAIAFYRKFGFVDAGTHAFMLGRDRQTDLIMTKALDATPLDAPPLEARPPGGRQR
jgi:diamine N-acetyltransferase